VIFFVSLLGALCLLLSGKISDVLDNFEMCGFRSVMM
jgi:hypothetical protein